MILLFIVPAVIDMMVDSEFFLFTVQYQLI